MTSLNAASIHLPKSSAGISPGSATTPAEFAVGGNTSGVIALAARVRLRNVEPDAAVTGCGTVPTAAGVMFDLAPVGVNVDCFAKAGASNSAGRVVVHVFGRPTTDVGRCPQSPAGVGVVEAGPFAGCTRYRNGERSEQDDHQCGCSPYRPDPDHHTRPPWSVRLAVTLPPADR